jgi:hypothetical protein
MMQYSVERGGEREIETGEMVCDRGDINPYSVAIVYGCDAGHVCLGDDVLEIVS